MLKIVCSILSRNESLVFREPVDWKGMGLWDYPEIVKDPMDLGTIKKKIENDEYEAVEDIANDIRLVWSNCMLYNRDGSEVGQLHAYLPSQSFSCCSDRIAYVNAIPWFANHDPQTFLLLSLMWFCCASFIT